MSSTLTARPPPLPAVPARSAPNPGRWNNAWRAATPSHANGLFDEMRQAFRGSGGLVRTEEVLDLFRCRGGPDVQTLARWIVAHDVVTFEWAGETWMPLFQIDPRTMTIRPELRPVLAELSPVFDAWELADWFARPNAWLGHRAPVDLLVSAHDAVLQAARADRYVAAS